MTTCETKLSILICSLEKRAGTLERLMQILKPQLSSDVEVRVNIDNGKKTICLKRNELLLESKGEYVCFIDDDDIVPDYYVSEILEAIKTRPDAVGFIGEIQFRNGDTYEVEYKHGNPNLFNGKNLRSIWHLQPVKREIALSLMYDDAKNRGQDRTYAKKLEPLIKSSVFINKKMYHYYADYNK